MGDYEIELSQTNETERYPVEYLQESEVNDYENSIYHERKCIQSRITPAVVSFNRRNRVIKTLKSLCNDF